MQRFVVKTILFLMLLVILDFVAGGILEKLYFSERSIASVNNKLDYSINKTNEEVLIFGASTARHGYVPAILEDSLGLSCYNVGEDGRNIYYYYAVLASIFERYTPRLVLLDLTTGEMAKNPVDFAKLNKLYPFYYSHKSVQEVVGLPGKFEQLKMLSGALRFNSKLLFILKQIIVMPSNGHKGYTPLYKVSSDSLQTQLINARAPDSLKLHYLKKLIGVCQQNNSQLVVLVSPVYFKRQGKSHNGVEALLRERNIPYWSYEQDSVFLSNPALFQDIMHLNHDGASAYTRLIASRLKSEGLIP